MGNQVGVYKISASCNLRKIIQGKRCFSGAVGTGNNITGWFCFFAHRLFIGIIKHPPLSFNISVSVPYNSKQVSGTHPQGFYVLKEIPILSKSDFTSSIGSPMTLVNDPSIRSTN